MDYARISKVVGKRATTQLGGLVVEVEVLNYKQSYGNDRWLVTPVAGMGEVWVESIVVQK